MHLMPSSLRPLSLAYKVRRRGFRRLKDSIIRQKRQSIVTPRDRLEALAAVRTQ